jgi:hypothetical protein
VTDVLIAEGGLVGSAVAIQLVESAFRPNRLSVATSVWKKHAAKV